MTQERAQQILDYQAARGPGAEIEMTYEERREIWAIVQYSESNSSVRDKICRIARGYRT